MEEYVILAGIMIACFFLGYFVNEKKPGGTVFIEESQDHERVCVRFVLDSNLDDIGNKKHLLLKVENKLSKKSQVV